jgi:hypothetical protein
MKRELSKIKVSFLLSATLFAASCAAANLQPAPADVSIQTILAHPSDFAGKKVRTKGWLNFRFEDCSLWATEKDENTSDVSAAIWVNGPKASCYSKEAMLRPKKGNVTVVGTVTIGHVGHLGMYSIAIVEAAITFTSTSKYQLRSAPTPHQVDSFALRRRVE